MAYFTDLRDGRNTDNREAVKIQDAHIRWAFKTHGVDIDWKQEFDEWLGDCFLFIADKKDKTENDLVRMCFSHWKKWTRGRVRVKQKSRKKFDDVDLDKTFTDTVEANLDELAASLDSNPLRGLAELIKKLEQQELSARDLVIAFSLKFGGKKIYIGRLDPKMGHSQPIFVEKEHERTIIKISDGPDEHDRPYSGREGLSHDPDEQNPEGD